MDWLGNNVKIFKVKGITIIANRNNGMVIGLDREGEEVVDLLKSNRIEIYCYEVRHDDVCMGISCELSSHILVNFWGTVISRTPLIKRLNVRGI